MKYQHLTTRLYIAFWGLLVMANTTTNAWLSWLDLIAAICALIAAHFTERRSREVEQ